MAAGDRPNGVRKARVALRRLRADLTTFAPLVEREWAHELRGELQWFGGLLGEVRDTEVTQGRLATGAEALPDDHRVGVAQLREAILAQQGRARMQLAEARGSQRMRELFLRLGEAAREPRFTERAEKPAAKAVMPLLSGAVRNAFAMVEGFGEAPRDEDLHRLRIRVKRVRYAARASSAALGKPARRVEAAAGVLQAILGAHQDAATFRRWLLEVAPTQPSEGAFTAGVLYEREAAVLAAGRRDWRRGWERLAAAAAPFRRP